MICIRRLDHFCSYPVCRNDDTANGKPIFPFPLPGQIYNCRSNPWRLFLQLFALPITALLVQTRDLCALYHIPAGTSEVGLAPPLTVGYQCSLRTARKWMKNVISLPNSISDFNTFIASAGTRPVTIALGRNICSRSSESVLSPASDLPGTAARRALEARSNKHSD